jgi:hypothetical protein
MEDPQKDATMNRSDQDDAPMIPPAFLKIATITHVERAFTSRQFAIPPFIT